MLKLLKLEHKDRVIFAFLSMLLASFDGVILSYIVSEAGEFSSSSTNSDVLLFALKSMLGWIIVYIAQYFYKINVAAIIKDFNIHLKTNYYWSNFANKNILPNSSDVISKLTNDFKLIENQYFEEFFDLISEISLCIVSLIYMLRFNLCISLLFLSLSFLPMIIPFLFSKPLQRAGDDWSNANLNYIDDAKDFLQGVNVLRTYEVYREIYIRIQNKLIQSEKQNFKLIRTQAIAEFISSVLAGISFIMPFVIGCFLIINTKVLSFSTLIAIFLLNDRVVGPLGSIASSINKIKTTEKLRKKLFVSDDNVPSMVMAKHNVNHQNILGTLSLCNLYYVMGNNYPLSVNVAFKSPFKVLIYGKSGCGKTTLLKLIKGDIQPVRGEVKAFDRMGVPFSLSCNTAYIAQNPYIFNTNLFENITLFQDFDKKRVIQVLKEVSLYEELGAENSLDYQCGSMGEKLSGGQIQRIEIARALLRDKKLLLVDEATANLDKSNANKIRNLLFRLPLPVIEVAHQYHLTDPRYTDIYEIKHGKLLDVKNKLSS